MYRDIDKIDLELVLCAYRDVSGNIDPENKIPALFVLWFTSEITFKFKPMRMRGFMLVSPRL